MSDRLIKNMLKDIVIPKRCNIKIKINNSCKSFISVTVSTNELFQKLVEKASPYVTNTCMDWLTDFGKNSVPRHFPHSTELEVNSLYDRVEVFCFLLEEFSEECTRNNSKEII